MGGTINTVRKNVNEFARNLAKDGVAARFGLATYSDEVYGRRLGKTDEDTILTKFGENYFTTDPVELEKALEKIKIAHWGEILLKQQLLLLQKIVSTYDWSKSPKNKKFVVLLTDARMKEDPVQFHLSLKTLTTLKKAGIDRIVATTFYNQRNYKDFVSEERLMDIDRNLADSLTKDAGFNGLWNSQ